MDLRRHYQSSSLRCRESSSPKYAYVKYAQRYSLSENGRRERDSFSNFTPEVFESRERTMLLGSRFYRRWLCLTLLCYAWKTVGVRERKLADSTLDILATLRTMIVSISWDRFSD